MSSGGKPPDRTLAAVVRNPTLRLFLLGQFLSSIGTWCQRITMGWLAYEFTGSAFWVGVVAACEVVPSMAVAPMAGAAIDNSDRARIFGLGQIAAAAQAAILAGLAFTGMLSLAVLVPMAAALGMIDGFNQPSRLVFISEVAPRELLRASISLNSIGFNLARFVGPAIGGLALSLGSPAAAFALNAISFLPVMILLLRLPRRSEASGDTSKSGNIINGLRYAISHPLIGTLLLQLVVLSLCARSAVELLPAVSATWFGGAPEALAKLTSVVGLGAIVGGFLMYLLQDVRSAARVLIILPGIQSTMVVALVLVAPGTLWSYAILAVLGICTIAIAVSMQNVIHLYVEDGYRGRVMSLYGLIQRAVAAVGAVIVGTIADMTTLFGALATAGAVAAAAWLMLLRHTVRALRKSGL